jgi:hypothetical protein
MRESGWEMSQRGGFYGMYREQRGDEKERRSEEEIRTKKKM